jgi:hypothetical protein
MGIIKYLAPFLEMLPEPCRVSYLPLLHDILHSTNPFNWRLRQYLALQLPELVVLPPKNELFRTVFPLVMILLQDPVASVRRDSFKGVTCLINELYILTKRVSVEDTNLVFYSKQHLEELVRAINSLIHGEKYQLRQLWVELCHNLLRDLPREVFERFFVPGVLALTSDTVSNVRVALSYFLVDWGSNNLPPWVEPSCDEDRTETPWHWLLRRHDIRVCIERLSTDDNDVYLNLVRLSPLFPDLTFVSMSCRGRKEPPGGLVPIDLDPCLADSFDGQCILSVDGDSVDGQSFLESHSEDNVAFSVSGFNVGQIADIHVNSNRSSFSSAADDDVTGSKNLYQIDMSAIDIDSVPRNRTSSFPSMEYIHSDDQIPIGIDEEMDIIDGIIRTPSKHGVSALVSCDSEDVFTDLCDASSEEHTGQQ